MAGLSIVLQPQQIQPAYNDIIFMFDSPNKAEPNFKYIADIQIGGDTIRLKTFPDSVYGFGVFNFGRIIETYVTKDLDITTFAFQKNENSFVEYVVSAGEEYGETIIEYPYISSSNRVWAWNGILDFIPFSNYGYLDYTSANTFVLNYTATLTRKIEYGQFAWLYFNQADVADFSAAIVTVYNSAGTIIRQCEVENEWQTDGTNSHHFIRFNCGTTQLNNIDAGLITDIVGSGAIIDPSFANYYTVQLTGNGTASAYTFQLVSSDCNYTTYRLHWLNKLGAIESFNFNKRTIVETEINRSIYKQVVGGITSESTYGYSVSDRGKKSYFTQMKDVLKLRTDWLLDLEYDMLQGLVESPDVYLESLVFGERTYYNISINCIDTKYITKTTRNEKCFALELSVEYSFDRYSQRQ